ncbi:MAG: ABC transporter permease [Bacillota bacterium]|jgi:peptide/nickel transport system permease protein|nr:ABC transporter permease [Bacillota bacterium]HHT89616.1 ABC transporter permease [Bacillota bacterium]
MQRYLLRRAMQLVPIMLGVSIITFFLIRLVPSNPALAILGVNATPDQIAYINSTYGLDKPIPVQYFYWMGKVLQFDLGRSIVHNQPTIELIMGRFPATLQVGLFAMFISLIVSLPVGVISAVKKDSILDVLGRFFAFVGISMPGFWLGLLLIILFAVTVPVFPIFGFVSIFTDFSEGIRHQFLPAVTLGLSMAAMVTRMTRSCVLEVLQEDYITTARGKGLPGTLVVAKHVLKNAFIPVITVVGLQVGFIFGGSVLVEVIFAIPGLGRLMVDSIAQRDYPVIQALVLVYAITFVLVNLLVDVLYAVLDPRIRYQ